MPFDILSPVLGKPGARREQRAGGNFGSEYYGIFGLLGVQQTAAGVIITPESSLRIATVMSCVRILAETMAQLPLHYKERMPGGTTRIADEQPLSQVVTVQPNDWQTKFEWIEMSQAHLNLRGNAYSRKVPGSHGAVSALIPLHPDRMQLHRLTNGRLGYTFTPAAGQPEHYTQDEILHLRNISLDGVLGISSIQAGRDTLGLAQAEETYASSFFKNSGAPGVVLRHPGKLLGNRAQVLRDDWERMHASAQKAHRTAVLEEGMDAKTLGMSMDEAQFIEGRKFSAEEICRIFRVPPHMVGILDKMTHCLPATEPVFTEHGPKSIAEVQAGEHVWSLNDDRQWVLSTVVAASCSGEDEIIEIKTRTRTLRCNGTHRVLVRRKVMQLYLGGQGRYSIVDGVKVRPDYVTDYVPAADIHTGDALISPNGLPDSGNEQAPTGMSIEPVLSVTQTGTRERVYDLTVADTHSFVANGVVVHNSNIEQQSLEFVLYTLLSWLRRWEAAMSRDLIEDPSRFFFQFDISELLLGDRKTRYEAYAIGRQWGWLSADDVRHREGDNPIGAAKGGDIYLSPMNMVPAAFVEKTAEATLKKLLEPPPAPVAKSEGQKDAESEADKAKREAEANARMIERLTVEAALLGRDKKTLAEQYETLANRLTLAEATNRDAREECKRLEREVAETNGIALSAVRKAEMEESRAERAAQWERMAGEQGVAIGELRAELDFLKRLRDEASSREERTKAALQKAIDQERAERQTAEARAADERLAKESADVRAQAAMREVERLNAEQETMNALAQEAEHKLAAKSEAHLEARLELEALRNEHQAVKNRSVEQEAILNARIADLTRAQADEARELGALRSEVETAKAQRDAAQAAIRATESRAEDERRRAEQAERDLLAATGIAPADLELSRKIVAETMGRMLRWEIKAIREAFKKPEPMKVAEGFYQEHEERLRWALDLPIRLHASLARVRLDARQMAREHVEASQRDLLGIGANGTMERDLDDVLTRWESRAEQSATRL